MDTITINGWQLTLVTMLGVRVWLHEDGSIWFSGYDSMTPEEQADFESYLEDNTRPYKIDGRRALSDRDLKDLVGLDAQTLSEGWEWETE